MANCDSIIMLLVNKIDLSDSKKMVQSSEVSFKFNLSLKKIRLTMLNLIRRTFSIFVEN